MSRLSMIADAVQKQVGQREAIQEQFNDQTAKLKNQKHRVGCIEKSAALVQKVATEMNNKVALQLTDITQAMVDSVFPGEYEVKLEFDIKQGRTHVDIYLDMDGEKIYPLDSDGGGVANMVELGLRLAALQLGNTRKTIVLDQPFKDLSREYLPLGAEILKKISKELGIQMIIINHIPELMEIADKTIEISKNPETKISSAKVLTQ